MARGEWSLAAELIYREIAASSDIREQAALYLELALIYDEKLLDAEQATRNYQTALDLDPSIPAAPPPLARLHELAGRHVEAARTYELAASLERDDSKRAGFHRRAALCAEHAGLGDEAQRLYELAAETTDDDADKRDSEEALKRLEILLKS